VNLDSIIPSKIFIEFCLEFLGISRLSCHDPFFYTNSSNALMKKQINHWLSRSLDLGLSYKIIVTLISLSLIATLTEIFGMGIFLPIFQFIRLEGNIDALVLDSPVWQYLISVFTFFDITPSLIVLLILSFSFFLFRQIFTYLRIIYTTLIRQKIIHKMQNRIFRRYIEADTAYHDKTPVGNLVNVITTELNGAVIGILAPLELIVYCITLLGYFSLLVLLSWEITLVSVLVLLLASFIPNIWIKKSKHTGRKLVGANMLMSEFLVGRLRSPRLVRLSSTEIAEKNEFYQLTNEQRKLNIYNSKLQAKTEVSLEPIVIGMSLVFLYFSYTVLKFQIEIIGLYLVIALRLMPIAKGIILQWQIVQRFLGSVEVIESRLQSMQDNIESDNGEKTLSGVSQSIVFNKVSYQYAQSNNKVLKNISIKFEIGKMTAIVGPSGGGKSTLVDLLPYLRVPKKGGMQIDGVDYSEYSLKSIRKMMAYVSQSPQIFDGTIRNHILYGKKDSTNEEIQKAVYLAGATSFINQLPEKFNTNLGEEAVILSGGQRQRLDLARALVRNAPILILDEPTSNLDAESEKAFRKSIARIRKETNTMIIVVAHNLLSISNADNIIVLKQGVVESSGSHSELLEKSEWYSNAWKIQSPTASQ